MTTQSLRGMANHGPMHWRGDRTGGTDATRLHVVASAQPDTGSFDEDAAFKNFNVAFAGLLNDSWLNHKVRRFVHLGRLKARDI